MNNSGEIWPTRPKKSGAEALRFVLVGEIHRRLVNTAIEARFTIAKARSAGEARSEFTGWIDRIGEIFRHVCEKHPALGWTEQGTGKICSEIAGEIRYLIRLACGASRSSAWCAPAWLAGWPAKMPTQEDKPLSLPLLDEAVKNRIAKRLVLVKMNRSTNKVKPRPHPAVLGEGFSRRAAELMVAEPTWSNLRILGKYDDVEGEVPGRWRKHQHREGTMLDAFRCEKCKHPLESRLWRLRKKLGLPSRH